MDDEVAEDVLIEAGQACVNAGVDAVKCGFTSLHLATFWLKTAVRVL